VTHPLARIADDVAGLGVDIEPVARFADPDLRLFTPSEIAHCLGRPDASERFAGRWCAKEAVLKALTGAPGRYSLRDVEIVSGPQGEPHARVNGYAGTVLVSIAHDGVTAVAVAWRQADPAID